MNGVCIVGQEFFGNVTRPFPSLEVLTFKAMRAWEVWSFSFGDKQIEEPFPRLSKLKLRECPKLVAGGWLGRLHLLVELDIEDCRLLKASSNSMVDLSLVEKLTLKSCSKDIVAGISSIIPNSLSKISLTSIQGLEYLNGDILRSLYAVESLEIKECYGLRWLWEDDVEDVKSLARLKSLRIDKCVNLAKLPNNMQRLTSLKSLCITTCSKLKYVPEGMMSCSSLETLYIDGCVSLKSFPEDTELPPTVIDILIYNCIKLETLPRGILKTNNDDTCSSSKPHATHLQLKQLFIGRCPSLKPLIGSNKKQGMKLVSSSLVMLTIFDCGVFLDCLLLEELSILQDCNIKSLQMLTCLSKLMLTGSSSLEVDVFPQLPSSLKSLTINGCKKIKSLPHRMHTSTSLEELELYNLSIESFPEGGLPLSLELLRVENCKNLTQPIEEWGLHNLTALRELYIEGEIGCLCLPGKEMTCFPPPLGPVHGLQAASDWSLLPPNIWQLWISSQPKLVSLSNGMRDHLICLETFGITSCPKLRFLPKDGFPPCLAVLVINGCTRNLQREYSKGGGYFPLIERIPLLELEMDS